jgi:hypothetical protein
MCRLLKFIEVEMHVQQIVYCTVLGLTFVVLTKSTMEIETDSVFFRACYSVALCLLY